MSQGLLTAPITDRDHAEGPVDAAITLVEYGDFECPVCREAFPLIKTLQRTLRGRLRFVFRHFPLAQVHPHAPHAAEVAEAAAAQAGGPGFWTMHDALFLHQDELGEALYARLAGELGLDTERLVADVEAGTFADRVRDDFRSGVRSGVNGTPTFFANGRRYDGAWETAAAFARGLEALATVTP